MRIVLDTNVLLSAVLKVGVYNRIVNASTEHAVFEIITTGKQLQELRDVMLRPEFKFGFMPAHADGYLSILYNQSEFIETVPNIPAMTRDANDEYLIYQTLIGAYPQPGEGDDGFSTRIQEYLQTWQSSYKPGRRGSGIH